MEEAIVVVYHMGLALACRGFAITSMTAYSNTSNVEKAVQAEVRGIFVSDAEKAMYAR